MRYFLTFLIGIGLVILVIILLIRAIFGGGGPTETQTPMIDYANSNVIMRLTIQGPVNSQQEHREVRIDVSQYSSDLRIIEGYENRVSDSETFNSNPSAYANFLRALDLLRYDEGLDNEERADERGYCPFGKRFVFEIIDGSSTIQRYWETDCGEQQGTSLADVNQVVDLFKAQIPEYGELVANVEGVH